MQSTLEEHTKLVDALERKDLQAALSSLEQHLEHGKQHVL
jgi:DNA-binding GntR family transcriptional regulator